MEPGFQTNFKIVKLTILVGLSVECVLDTGVDGRWPAGFGRLAARDSRRLPKKGNGAMGGAEAVARQSLNFSSVLVMFAAGKRRCPRTIRCS
ncbi:hypothetical protein [Acidocella aquatica]|uniref:hypothetical protein n=1 Tax=Acidocella aquatica TaxID=1922313 RepID=UPI0024E07E62|nr:hypothetical protein [Acidocella aquatica]